MRLLRHQSPPHVCHSGSTTGLRAISLLLVPVRRLPAWRPSSNSNGQGHSPALSSCPTGMRWTAITLKLSKQRTRYLMRMALQRLAGFSSWSRDFRPTTRLSASCLGAGHRSFAHPSRASHWSKRRLRPSNFFAVAPRFTKLTARAENCPRSKAASWRKPAHQPMLLL